MKIILMASVFWMYAFSAAAQNNTSAGTQALFSLSSGQENTAIGFWSLYSGTHMDQSSAFGSWSMYYNQGSRNTAMGGSSLFYNTNGYENTAAGYRALFNNTLGFRNTAIGVDALYSNNSYSSTQAVLNTAAGYMAMANNTSGNFNVAVGAYSGSNNYTGSYNAFVGYGADFNTPANYRFSAAIGSNAIATSGNMIRFGDNNVTVIGGQVGWATPSDRRVKKNIQTNVPGLSFIKLLDPVVYQYDTDAYSEILNIKRASIKHDSLFIGKANQSKQKKEAVVYSGFLAQDVAMAANSIGYDFSGVITPKHNQETYRLRYVEFVVPLVKSVQELSLINDSLENELSKVNSKIDFLLGNTKRSEAYKGESIMSNSLVASEMESAEFILQNYPNPFKDVSRISFKLPNVGEYTIAVFSPDGKRLRTINLPKVQKGFVEFKRGNLPQGTYTISLLGYGHKIISKRMMIVNQ